MEPNLNGLNYNYSWNEEVIPVTTNVTYPCQDNQSHEGPYDLKEDAPIETIVLCGSDGEFNYPNPWPQCSHSIQCADPGNSTEVSRRYLTDVENLEYLSVLEYRCDDRRKWIKHDGSSSLSWSLDIMCHWRKTYNTTMTDLVCEIHHCRHPHNEPGSHQPPPSANDLHLVEDFGNNIQFGEKVKYDCPIGMFFENNEVDPTQTRIEVECLQDIGEYNTPVRNSGSWPNCTKTVVCGIPPDVPVNGSRTWVSPAVDDQETYDTKIVYACQDGSQFDTDGNGIGDSITVEIRCQWNKQWFPYTVLPTCIVTHCIEPFKIPTDSGLEELTSDWTPIYTYKQYQCKNHVDSIPTMFWETDRSKSTFKLYCNPSGYFTWLDWPKCLTDITCSPNPPKIPTNPEYILPSDDGTIVINSLIYPVYPIEERTTNLVLNSTNNFQDFPQNYMANLTYSCGSAREFHYADGSHSPSQSMTCQWNRVWTPTATLGTCDWVACLSPPLPPSSTNLEITHWFGDPIPFGEDVMYVCKNGYHFEEDYHQVGVNYTCQDGLNVGLEHLKGFINTPGKEEDWPKCKLTPLCQEPPEIPDEGIREIISLPITSQKFSQCSLNEEILNLGCHSFLNVYVKDVTYGRNASNGFSLCGGSKTADILAPNEDCYDDTINSNLLNQIRSTCNGHHGCSPMIPSLSLSSACEGKRKEAVATFLCGLYLYDINNFLLSLTFSKMFSVVFHIEFLQLC